MPYRRIVINQYMDIGWINNQPTIVVDGKPFRHCMFLVASLSPEQAEQINSIDELAEVKGARSMEGSEPTRFDLTPPEIMRAHASNLQAWSENGYDTRILHSNLAFPLLRELSKVGDPKAKRVLEIEIHERLQSGFRPTVLSIIDCCLNIIPHEDLTWMGREGYLDQQNLRRFESPGVNLSGSKITRSIMSYSKLQKSDFRNVNLYDSTLEYSDLRSALFDFADVTKVSFRKCNMSYVSFKNTTIRSTGFREANLRHSNFEYAVGMDSMFYTADLRYSSFKGATILDADFGLAICNESDFTRVNAVHASFNAASMKNVACTNGNFSGASFRLSDLEQAIFKNANLNNADFNGANLKNADLRGASIKGATFKLANITGMKIDDVYRQMIIDKNNGGKP